MTAFSPPGPVPATRHPLPFPSSSSSFSKSTLPLPRPPSPSTPCRHRTRCVLEAFNSLRVDADLVAAPAARGSFGDVFFGHTAHFPVVLKRARPGRTAQALYLCEKRINDKLATSTSTSTSTSSTPSTTTTPCQQHAQQRWPHYLGEYVRHSTTFLVWRREPHADTLAHYLSARPVSDLYAALRVSAVSTAPLRPALCKAVLQGLLRALRDAHAAGVVHRDVKPENMLITQDDTVRVKLIDWGSACDVSRFLWNASGIDTLDELWTAPERRLSLLHPAKFDVFSAALVALAVLVPDLSVTAFRHGLEDAGGDLRAYRTRWNSTAGGGGGGVEALFNSAQTSEVEPLFNLLASMLRKNPADRCSVKSALFTLSNVM